MSFPGGVMHVGGQPQRPAQVQHWESSNELAKYTTVTWVDPATGEKRTSCNCPGWTNKRGGEKRHCTHTKDMEGIKPCNRKKLSENEIKTVAEAVALIPDIVDGRELRGIML